MKQPQLAMLANGLRLVLVEDPHARSSHVAIWVMAGTRNERSDEEGLAHFLEHMAFKGTGRRSAFDIVREVEDVGANINAYTARDHTVYHGRCLSEHMALLVEILADIVTDSNMREEDVAVERDVVLQEIAQAEDIPDEIIFDIHNDVTFPGQSLGHRTLGKPERVQSYKAKEVHHLLERFANPARMVLVVAGPHGLEELQPLAERYLGPLKARLLAHDTSPAQSKGGLHLVPRKSEQTHLCWTFPVAGLACPEYVSWQLFANLFGGGMSSPLFQEVRESRGLAYSVYAFYSGLVDCGQLGISMGTSSERMLEACSIAKNVLERLATGEVEEEALIRARNQTKAASLMALEHAANLADHAARQLQILGHLEDPLLAIEALDQMGTKDIMRMAQSLFAQASSSAVVLGGVRSADQGPLEAVLMS